MSKAPRGRSGRLSLLRKLNKRRARKYRATLQLQSERLEDRRLLTDYTLASGTITRPANAGNDRIDLSRAGVGLQVVVGKSETIAKTAGGSLNLKGNRTVGQIDVVGSPNADIFKIRKGAGLTGSLDGGAMRDVLSYTAIHDVFKFNNSYTQPVRVNLGNQPQSELNPGIGQIITVAANTATAVGKRITNVEVVIGGTDKDVLFGLPAMPNRLAGARGDDFLVGGSQADVLVGGGKFDVALVAAFRDRTNDELRVAHLAGLEALKFFGNTDHDVLVGKFGVDLLIGGSGNDILVGGPGDDWLHGGQDDDTYVFAGNWGHDTIVDPSGHDTLDFRAVVLNDDFPEPRQNADGGATYHFGNGNSVTVEARDIEVLRPPERGPETGGPIRQPRHRFRRLPNELRTYVPADRQDVDLSRINEPLQITIAGTGGNREGTDFQNVVTVAGIDETPRLVFYNVENLTGGQADTTYKFVQERSLAGTVRNRVQLLGNLAAPADAAGRHVLDYSEYKPSSGLPLQVNLTSEQQQFGQVAVAMQPEARIPIPGQRVQLPRQEVWTFEVPAVRGEIQVAIGEARSDAIKFDDNENSRSRDQQKFKKALSLLIERSDFSVLKDQTVIRGVRHTRWKVIFSEPKLIELRHPPTIQLQGQDPVMATRDRGQNAVNQPYLVGTNAIAGDLMMEVRFVDLGGTRVEGVRATVRHNATARDVQEALNVAIDRAVNGNEFRLDAVPHVLVTGIGTHIPDGDGGFPWEITLANMGVATLTAELVGAPPEQTIAPNTATGIAGTVTRITGVVGSKDGDHIFGVQQNEVDAVNFTFGANAAAVEANNRLVVPGHQSLTSGAPVLYKKPEGGVAIPGLVHDRIYYITATKQGIEATAVTQIQFFTTADDFEKIADAIKLKAPTGDGEHRLLMVVEAKGGDGDDRILSYRDNQASASRGGDGDDTLVGSNGSDYVSGGDGDDQLYGDATLQVADDGGGGQDVVLGGKGHDSVYGYRGPDHLLGGPGDDFLVGGAGNDFVEGGDGDDTLAVIEAGRLAVVRRPNDERHFQKAIDYDRFEGGAGNDSYVFEGTWGVASLSEGRTLTGSNDTIDLSSLTDNYVHVLSHSSLASVPGSLENTATRSTIRVADPNRSDADAVRINLGIPLEDLKGSRRSPGNVVTELGFGLHQSAVGKPKTGFPNAELEAAGRWRQPSGEHYERLDFRLSVDRGSGPVIYNIPFSLPDRPLPRDSNIDAVMEALRLAIQDAYPGGTPGLTVEIATDKLPGGSSTTPKEFLTKAKRLRFVVSPDGSLDQKGNVIPPRIEFTVDTPNTVVVGDAFQYFEKIKTSAGANTFVFGNDYWSGGNLGATLAQTLPIADVIARNTQGKLEIDTSQTNKEDAPLVLDFRAVNHELFFSFSPNRTPQGDVDPDTVTLTVRSVTNLNIPIVGVGPEYRTNTLVFTHVDKNTILYGGRYKNTFEFGRNATFRGHLIGGEGRGAIGYFSGRASDRALDTLNYLEGVATGLSATDVGEVVFQVENSISYSNFEGTATGNGLLSTTGSAVEQFFKAPFNITRLNLEELRTGGERKSARAIAGQVALGNVFGPAFDWSWYKNNFTSMGFSGLSENTQDASIGDVIVRSGFNVVRGTDYSARDDVLKFDKNNPLAVLTSGADTISVGDNALSLTPGVHILLGGSGADTYKFNSQLWGIGLAVDDISLANSLLQPDLGTDTTGAITDAVIDGIIPQDTLDFSDVYQDLYYTVVQFTLQDVIAMFHTVIHGNSVDIPYSDLVGINAVLVTGFDPLSPQYLPSFFEGGEFSSDKFSVNNLLSLATLDNFNLAIGIGIENIIGSRGNNKFNFLNGAKIHGRIGPGFGGSTELDYSLYNGPSNTSRGAVTDLDSSGIDYASTQPNVDPRAKTLIPSVAYQYGHAEGVGGGRLGVVEGGNVTGTAKNDTLGGNSGDNLFVGLGGRDIIVGEGGNDTLLGGDGNDTLIGGKGNDALFAGPDSDGVDGNDGDDVYIPNTDQKLLVTFPALNVDDSGFAERDEIRNVSEIRINKVFHSSTEGIGKTITGLKFPASESEFYVENGVTFNVNPRDFSIGDAKTYVVNVFSKNQVDFNKYGNCSIDGYDSAKQSQIINFFEPVSERVVLTLDVRGHSIPFTFGDCTFTTESKNDLLSELESTQSAFVLHEDQLPAIRLEATRRWQAALGKNDKLSEVISQLAFSVVDLEGRALARVDGQSVQIDVNAAGHGWFVDASPHVDTEFTTSGPTGSSIANEQSQAYARYDLLSVVMHEIGHSLGLSHNSAAGSLMASQLDPGTRLSISSNDVLAINVDSPTFGNNHGADVSDEEKLLDGLDEFATWADNLGTEIGNEIEDVIPLPFISDGLQSLWEVTGIGSTVRSTIRQQVLKVFAGDDEITTEDFLSLDTDVLDINQAPSNLGAEFEANIELTSASTCFSSVDAECSEISLDFLKDLGVDLTSFASLEMPTRLELEAAIDLRFGFGIDVSTGHFYVEDPSLVGRVTLDHLDDDGNVVPLDVSLNVGPLGVGIEDGRMFFQAGIVIPTEGRFGVADLVDGLEFGAPRFDPNSSYEIDLPFHLQGALAGLTDEVGRVHGSFNRDGNPALAVENLTASQFFTLIPDTISFDGPNFDALINLSKISLDEALEGIKQTLISALDPDDPDDPADPNDSVGIAYQQLPFINQSAVDLLGTGSIDVVEAIVNGIDVVQENLTDINHFEIDLNQVLNSTLQLGLDLGGEEVDAAYDRIAALSRNLYGTLVGISAGLTGTSTESDLELAKQQIENEVAIALAEKNHAIEFSKLLLSREVAAAGTRLASEGLGANSTNEEIAIAIADGAQLGSLRDDWNRVAQNTQFAAAWNRLTQNGFDAATTESEIEALFDVAEFVELALDSRTLLSDDDATDNEKQVARIQLVRMGVPAGATEQEIRDQLNQSDRINQLKADLVVVGGANGTLKEAASRLNELGLDSNSSVLGIATAIVGVETLEEWKSYRDFINDSGIALATASSNLRQNGLDAESTGAQIANALVDQGVRDARVSDWIDTLQKYEFNKSINLDYGGSVLDVHFSMSKAFGGEEYDIDFDLEDLPGLGDVLTGEEGIGLDLDTEGKVFIDADIDFDLNFTFDLSELGSPSFVIYDDSQITFNKLIIETNADNPIDVVGSITVNGDPVLSLAIKDATIDVDLVGTISLTEDSEDHFHKISELASDSSLWNVDLIGSVAADLPFYFPTDTFPFGGSDADLDSDGIPDNVLHVDGTFTGPNEYDLNFVTPRLNFADVFDIFAWLNNPAAIVDGLNTVFDTAETGIRDYLEPLQLPFVGDALKDAPGFLDGLQKKIVGDDNPNTPESGLHALLAPGIAEGKSTFEIIREAVYESIGDQLVTPDGSPVTSPDQIPITISDDAIEFKLLIGGEVIPRQQLPLNFSGAVPGLNLGFDSNASVNVDFTYLFAFGFGFSKTDGFYLDTSGGTPTGEEFALDLSVTLTEDIQDPATVAATLGFLKLQLTDVIKLDEGSGRQRGSGLFGSFDVDLIDKGGDGRMTIFGRGGFEGMDVEARLTAEADFEVAAKLALVDSSGKEASFPSISTTIHFDQNFAQAKLSTASGSSLTFGGSPRFVLENVSLDLGTFISDFARPVLEQIDNVTRPLQPVLDVINTDLPVLSDLGLEISLLDLAELYGGDKFNRGFIDALVAVRGAVEALNEVPANEPVIIGFGDFVIMDGSGKNDLRDPKNKLADTPPPNTSSYNLNNELDHPSGQTANGGTGKSASAKTKNFISKLRGLKGISLPIIENPTAVFGLLAGDKTAPPVDLLTYDVPQLALPFRYRQTLVPFPNPILKAEVSGGATILIDVGFGFDSTGLVKYFESGKILDVFDGFHIRDVKGGADTDELTLQLDLSGEASFDAFVAAAGLEAGVRADIGFNLADPNGDGVVRADELRERLDLGPLCVFDVHGGLNAFIDAYLSVGPWGFIYYGEVEEEYEILEFASSCSPGQPPVYSELSDGVLTLNMGPRAGQRLVGDTTDADESFQVSRQTRDGQGVLVVSSKGNPELQIVGNRRVEKTYPVSSVTKIVAHGGRGNDKITIQDGVTADIEIDGGEGSDKIKILTTNAVTAGRSIVRGGPNDDLIITGAGVDFINGGGGSDTIRAGRGNDQLLGGDGDDTLDGQEGNDWLEGEAGPDTLFGGMGADIVLGGADEDEIHWRGLREQETVNDRGQTQQVIADDGADSFVDGGGGDDVFLVTATENGETLNFSSRDASNWTSVRPDGKRITVSSVSVFASVDATSMRVTQVETLSVNALGGEDAISLENLAATSIADVDINLGSTVSATAPTDDQVPDALTIRGGGNADQFTVSTQDGHIQVSHESGSQTMNISVFNASRSAGDRLSIEGNAGNDTIDASMLNLNIAALSLDGEAGDDTLVGSQFSDKLFGGTGSDTLTGNRGLDFFFDNSSESSRDIDTLAEYQNADMTITGNYFFAGQLLGNSGGQLTVNDVGDRYANGVEVENLRPNGTRIFERAELIATSTGSDAHTLVVNDRDGSVVTGDETLVVTAWTGDVVLGNGAGRSAEASRYLLNLLGSEGDVTIADGHLDNDLLQIYGLSGPDVVRLDRDGDIARDNTPGLIEFAMSGLDDPNRTTVRYSHVERVEINTLSGNDVVHWDENPVPTTIKLGSGDDRVIVGNAISKRLASSGNTMGMTIFAEDGLDHLDYSSWSTRVVVDLQVPRATGIVLSNGFEWVSGGAGNDEITGDANQNVLRGNGGNDFLFGMGDRDVIYGGAGEDQIFAGPGDDEVWGGANSDTIDGQEGSDTQYGGSGIDLFIAPKQSTGTDIINGHFGNEQKGDSRDDGATDILVIRGSNASENIVLSQVDNESAQLNIRISTPTGFATSEVQVDWMGDDGDPLIEQFQVAGLGGNDKIGFGSDIPLPGIDPAFDLSNKPTKQLDLSLLTRRSNDFVGVFDGNGGDDTLIGSPGRDRLDGGLGSDVIFGFAGNDRLWGDSGDGLPSDTDVLFAGQGHDDLLGGEGKNVLYAWSLPPVAELTPTNATGSEFHRLAVEYRETASQNDFEPRDSFGVLVDEQGRFVVDANGSLEPTGLNRIIGNTNDDLLFGGTEVDFLYGNGGRDTLFRKDGTTFASLDGGEAGDEWKEYAKSIDAVWYVPASNANDRINVDFVTEPGFLQGHHLITRLTENEGAFSFDAQVRLDFDAVDENGQRIWDIDDIVVDANARTFAVETLRNAQGLTEELAALRTNVEKATTKLVNGLLPPEGDYLVIIIDALDGNDEVIVGPTVQKTVWVDAGAGDDRVELLAGKELLPDQTEAIGNDEPDSAYPIQFGPEEVALAGLTIDRPTDEDWYRITLPHLDLEAAWLGVQAGGHGTDFLDIRLKTLEGGDLLVPPAATEADQLDLTQNYDLGDISSHQTITGLTIPPNASETYTMLIEHSDTADHTVLADGRLGSCSFGDGCFQQSLEIIIGIPRLNREYRIFGGIGDPSHPLDLVGKINSMIRGAGLANESVFVEYLTLSDRKNRGAFSLNVAHSLVGERGFTIRVPAGENAASDLYGFQPGTHFSKRRIADNTMIRVSSDLDLRFKALDFETSNEIGHPEFQDPRAIGTELDLSGYPAGKISFDVINNHSESRSYDILNTVGNGNLDRSPPLVPLQSVGNTIALAHLTPGESYLLHVANDQKPTSYALILDLDGNVATVGESLDLAGVSTSSSRRDVILGGDGDDILIGGPNEDFIFGEGGDDVLSGGRDALASDLLFGGRGNDTFQVIPDVRPLTFGNSADQFVGGDGFDRVLFRGGDLDRRGLAVPDYAAIRFNSTLLRYEFASLVWDIGKQRFMSDPVAPDQYLKEELFFQTRDIESIQAVLNAGDDVFHADANFHFPKIDGTQESDSWGIAIGAWESGARQGKLIIDGGAGDDQIFGGALADHLYGRDGNDVLVGGPGNDVIDGGFGINRYESPQNLRTPADISGEFDRFESEAFRYRGEIVAPASTFPSVEEHRPFATPPNSRPTPRFLNRGEWDLSVQDPDVIFEILPQTAVLSEELEFNPGSEVHVGTRLSYLAENSGLSSPFALQAINLVFNEEITIFDGLDNSKVVTIDDGVTVPYEFQVKLGTSVFAVALEIGSLGRNADISGQPSGVDLSVVALDSEDRAIATDEITFRGSQGRFVGFVSDRPIARIVFSESPTTAELGLIPNVLFVKTIRLNDTRNKATFADLANDSVPGVGSFLKRNGNGHPEIYKDEKDENEAFLIIESGESWFRFKTLGDGQAGDVIRINSPDIKADLIDDQGFILAADRRIFDLRGYDAGTFYLRVRGEEDTPFTIEANAPRAGFSWETETYPDRDTINGVQEPAQTPPIDPNPIVSIGAEFRNAIATGSDFELRQEGNGFRARDLASVASLDIGSPLTNLNGIEHLVNLETLRIAQLDVASSLSLLTPKLTNSGEARGTPRLRSLQIDEGPTDLILHETFLSELPILASLQLPVSLVSDVGVELITPAGQPYNLEAAAAGTLAYYEFEETDGRIAGDSSFAGNDATYRSGTTLGLESVDPIRGKAVQLDGTGDYIDLPDMFDDLSAGFSVELWAKPTAIRTWGRFIDLGNGSATSNVVFGRVANSNSLFFEFFDGATSMKRVTIEDAIALNEWHHYAATLSGDGNIAVYVDGAEVGRGKADRGAPITRRGRNYIGRSNWSGDQNFAGLIDNVSFSNRVRSAGEIKASFDHSFPSEVGGFFITDHTGAEVALSTRFTPAETGTYEVNFGIGFVAQIFAVNESPVLTREPNSNVNIGEGTELTASEILDLLVGSPDASAFATDVNGDDLHTTVIVADPSGKEHALGTAPLEEKFLFENEGDYGVRISVYDPDGESDTVESSIRINNVPPTPVALPSREQLLGTSAFYTAEGSTDVGPHDVLSYRWNVTTNTGQSVRSSNAREFSFVPKFAGTYEVSLTVIDDQGADSTTASMLTVNQVADITQAIGANTRFFDSQQALSLESGRDVVALGDIDGDGDLDAWLTERAGGDRVFLNDGFGNFADSGRVYNTSDSVYVELADLDSDGDLDAFVAALGPNQVWINQGDFQGAPFFLKRTIGGFGSADSVDVSLGDLDGDDDIDALVANRSGANQVWLNAGDGSFTAGVSLGNSNSGGVSLADLDSDGDLDAFVAESGPNTVWLNNGNAAFIRTDQNLGNAGSEHAALGDLDDDGDIDAFVANSGGGTTANEVWVNDGSGRFQLNGSYGQWVTSYIDLADIDHDGDLDAFAANWQNNANRLWINDGSGDFTSLAGDFGSYTSHALLRDLNGDELTDIYLAQYSSQDRVLFGSSIAEGDTATLSAASSPGPSLEAVRIYTWRIEDPAGNNLPVANTAGESLVFSPPADGVYNIYLRVTDHLGGEVYRSEETRQVLVVRDLPPDLQLVGESSITQGTFALTVEVQDEAPEDQFEFMVDWNDGTQETFGLDQLDLTHEFTAIGQYNIVVTAKDLATPNSIVSQSILVDVANAAPTVSVSASIGVVQQGDPVTLTATVFDYEEGHKIIWEVVENAIDFIQYLGGSKVSFAAEVPGTYIATASVTDRYGAVGAASITITVEEKPSQPARIPGDLDGNGSVDFSDFLTLAENFGSQNALPSEGDIDGDKAVAFGDFLVLAMNFGKSLAARAPDYLEAATDKYFGDFDGKSESFEGDVDLADTTLLDETELTIKPELFT